MPNRAWAGCGCSYGFLVSFSQLFWTEIVRLEVSSLSYPGMQIRDILSRNRSVFRERPSGLRYMLKSAWVMYPESRHCLRERGWAVEPAKPVWTGLGQGGSATDLYPELRVGLAMGPSQI